MKRILCLLTAVIYVVMLCGCSTTYQAKMSPVETTAAVTPKETTAEPAVQQSAAPSPSETPGDWAANYTAFLEDNYDVITALWPEGLTGVGFIDLDLDGTPEMVLFDMGASATLGVQLFDYVDGKVWCVSSVQPDAAGAFGAEHMSALSVCASYFESFRLMRGNDGKPYFYVTSANGTIDSSWEEIIRFSSQDGFLTLQSVCYRDSLCNTETGLVIAETYEVGGTESTEEQYNKALSAEKAAKDLGYEAKGVFLWNDMSRYDTTCNGLLAMARDAAAAYTPIE